MSFSSERNCTGDDYYDWSPFNDEANKRCLLGQKELIKRRKAHVPCYNGIHYERPVTKKYCVCDRSDYEWYVEIHVKGHYSI